MPWIGPKGEAVPPHPRPEPRFEGDLTADRIRWIFRDSADFGERPVLIGGDPAKRTTVFFLNGQVRNERMNDYILRPLATSPLLREATPQAAFRMMTEGIVYTQLVQVCTTLDQAVFALINGSVVFAFPGEGRMISYFAATEEKRALSPPENEPSLKGARDSFVESLRTNTSLVRRRLRAPELKIAEVIAGRQTVTPVDILYIEGITNPDLVAETKRRLAAVDTDELLQTASLEELIVDEVDTAFPMLAYTERPDRFCAGLVEGRVGVIVDGIPLGYLLPGTVGQFFKTGQDRAQNWVAASFLSVLRYLCMLLSLFLPAWYVAAVNFHPEMIPARLAWSISEAKTDVPFSTIFEVLIMLLAFEAVQEAGLRLPGAIGQTASILGGLVVGSAAVEASIVSPVVLIVVAIAVIVKMERTRRQRVRTVYVGDCATFNSEQGLATIEGSQPVSEVIAGILQSLKYDFSRADFPDKDRFVVKYFVRTKQFEAEEKQGSDTVVDSEQASAGAAKPQIQQKTWTGEVFIVETKEERPFGSPEELARILASLEQAA